MSILLAILTSTLLVSLIAFSVILLAGFLQKYTHQLIAYASGIMLTVALLNLIPESLATLESGIFILLGFLGFLILESFFHWHHCADNSCENSRSLGWLVLVSDAFHNFTDGVLIAAAWMTSPAAGIATTIAVAAHELPQEVSDYIILLHAGFSRLGGAIANLVSGLTAVIGGLIAYGILTTMDTLIPYFLSIAAGGFLYIATVDLLPEVKHHAQERSHVLKHTLLFLLGVATIFFLHPLVNLFLGI